MADILDSTFVKKYKKRMIDSLSRMRPEWDTYKIEEVVDKLIKKEIQNPKVEMDNNYTGEHQEASLISVFDWAFKTKPILAGNGTFYKNQYEALNPVATMLNTILQNRKDTKKKMFKVKDDTSNLYKDLDREQKNYKILVNSYYGASGAPTSAFYSEWSGPTCTITAQQVISTTENTFEAFVVDNYNFLDINELFDWVQSFLPDSPLIIDEWVQPVDDDRLYERLISKVLTISSEEREMIWQFVKNLDETDKRIVYYKNNLIQFIEDHKRIKKLYEDIFKEVINYDYYDEKDPDWRIKVRKSGCDDTKFETVKDWNNFVNREYFMDPNSVPDSISEMVKRFSDYLMTYVYTPYMPFDRVYRLKNFVRKTVTVIDTDSNILALDQWVNWTLSDVMNGMYGRDKMKNVFIAVNTLTYVLTQVVTSILLQYGEYANVPEEFRPRLNMKNELNVGSCKISLIAGMNSLGSNYQTMAA